MTLSKMQMTIIHCEKLQNIVGQGRSAPYQVSVQDGAPLGMMGRIVEPGCSTAANQAVVSPSAKNSWLKQALGKLLALKN